MKIKFLIILASVGLFISIPNTFASEPQLIQIFQPDIELLPDETIEYGESFTIRAWLQSYDDRPEGLGFFVDVLDPHHNQVDSTLWFARQDFVYEFDTMHPAYNVTQSGNYLVKLERADFMERTGSFPKTISFEILFPEPEQDRPLGKNCGPGTLLEEGICVVAKDDKKAESSSRWGTYQDITSPLKQIKSGVALVDVQCSEGKSPAYKYNRMSVACVSEETLVELWDRGWATMRFYTDDDTSSHALCNNYEGKWHPEHNGCRGDISDLQCSLMGGKFVDNLKICYNDICPKNKTYTLCVTNSNYPEPEPPSTSTQCKPGLPPFHSDFYLDQELCKWKLIPEPIPNEVIPYVWNSHLQKKQIDFSPKDRSYFNFGEGFDPENENRACSPIILTNKTELYISSTFTIEPFEIINTVTSEIQHDDCHKIWKAETLLVEPSPELGAWLKNYWEKENED